MFSRLIPICLLAVAVPLRAQNVFVVVENGTPQPVKAVHGTLLDVGTQIIRASSKTVYSLRPAPAYRPGFVQIRYFDVTPVVTISSSTSVPISDAIYIHATLFSEAPLTNFFVVLELTRTDKHKGLLFCDLPDLKAKKETTFDIRLYAYEDVARANIVYHFFSDGMEILQSQMSPPYIAEQKRRTAEYFQPDRDISVLKASAPTYPKNLTGPHPPGSATVRFTIDTAGSVTDAEVTAATAPQFGQAAIEAVRQWKFTPAFQNHHLVATTLEISLKFKPPATDTGP